jgi:hypothetical protein
MQGESEEARCMKKKLASSWRLLPSGLRKLIVLVFGSTLIIVGLLLIVLPGPFTMPLVIGGLVVLALEFKWAETLLVRVKHHGQKIMPRKLFKKR